MKVTNERVDSGSEWYESRPTHWQLTRLDRVANAWPSSVDKHTVPNESAVRLCNYVDVYKNDEIVEHLDFMRATASPDQIERFRLKLGDTLVTKDSETADDIGIPAFVCYEAPDLVCGYHLSIVRPLTTIAFPRFIFWVLGSRPILDQWAALASGVTRVGLRAGDLAKAAILLPPLDEQRAIADCLDRETARIDTLIEEQQRLIDLLRERRHATLFAAVTVGINAVEACKSGTGWMGSVNRTWKVGPLRELVVERNVRNEGAQDTRYLSVMANTGVIPYEEKGDVGNKKPEDLSKCKIVQRGDMVINSMNYQIGSYGLSRYDGVCSPVYIVLKSRDDIADRGYVARLCEVREFQRYAQSYGNGILDHRRSISWSTMKNLRVPITPLDEQRRITTFLDEETSRIDALIGESERLIELSRERRSALITAAVTGQIDVRDEVA